MPCITSAQGGTPHATVNTQSSVALTGDFVDEFNVDAARSFGENTHESSPQRAASLFFNHAFFDFRMHDLDSHVPWSEFSQTIDEHTRAWRQREK
mmetsp:Transcript_65880/g.143808  ORF Transcript_65880/g.143808 Transcript_65880/m.143808 type:complete len:95 (-) Transcript_65880:68-352(-)